MVTDLQYILTLNGSKHANASCNNNKSIKNKLQQPKLQTDEEETSGQISCLNGKNLRIQELEMLLEVQNIQHQKELDKKKLKIEELEKSISTAKEVNKLQNECKNLYQNEDKMVLRRIGNISDRAARRGVEQRKSR